MDKLERLTDSVMTRLQQSRDSSEKPNSTPASTVQSGITSEQSTSASPVCPLCKGSGWLMSAELEMTRMGHLQNKLIRCQCKREEDKIQRRTFLLKMDGLTDTERQRRFSNIQDSYEPGLLPSLKLAVEQHRGLITLHGGYGRGKTTLLICAVNEAREQSRLAIYTTTVDLLNYLRSTFSPDSEDSFDKYWDALVRCEVLALDELDEFSTTPWAMEKFLSLMDERWRRMDEVLTICALNNRIQALPGKVQSRLRDGRGKVIEITGADMRSLNTWE